MGYATEGLKLLAPGIDSGPSLWTYVSTDVHTDVDASGYFTDGAARGLKVGDAILLGKSDATIGYVVVYVQTVTALDASPYTTVASAILA
ncbi:hypothetical protein LCGC14_1944810 [marine sediment metagenome]|uniref:Uncharacterized protein n=1 Tax=marine sediment metagenome TaxID=412755 RepID=A0A0F9G7I3_9ZZZZ